MNHPESVGPVKVRTSLAGGGLHDGVQHGLPLLVRRLLRLPLLLLLLRRHLLPALNAAGLAAVNILNLMRSMRISRPRRQDATIHSPAHHRRTADP